MTKDELNQLWHINREIEEIKSEIENISYLEAVRPKESVQTSNISDSTGDIACELAELTEQYNSKLRRMYRLKSQIEKFLDGITDNEIRLIFRLRHVNNLTWNEIAAETGYERTTVSKKYKRYLRQVL
jgi:predicted nuclease with TOPRIM domain